MELIIEPHIGVGPIHLNMRREEVREALGKPNSSHGNRDTFLSGLHVNYDPDGQVEFIEVASSSQYTAVFKGKDVHRTPWVELLFFINNFVPFDPYDSELGYRYIFKGFQLSLWRSVMPKSGEDPEGQYFEGVGIGTSGYFL